MSFWQSNKPTVTLPFLFARHGHNLTGVSPERGLIVASAQPKTRVSIARWNLKEVGGKALA